MKEKEEAIRLPAQWIPYRSMILFCMGILVAQCLSFLVLSELVSANRLPGWTMLFPCTILAVILLIGLIHPLTTFAYITPNGVSLRVLGFTVRRIDASALRLICAVSNGRDPVLCLSCRTQLELAQLRVEQMRKGIFTREELPLRQGKLGWEGRFAREYLNSLLYHPIKAACNPDLLWLNMEQTAAVAVRSAFPHLPYRNKMEKHLPAEYVKPNQLPTNALERYPKFMRLVPEGMAVVDRDQTIWFMPAERVRTILRVDRFTSYSRIEPEHAARLVVCSLSKEELAARSKLQPAIRALSAGTDVAALDYCLRSILFWKKTDTQLCPLRYSAQLAQELKRRYPDAQWIDLSDYWLADFSPPDSQ